MPSILQSEIDNGRIAKFHHVIIGWANYFCLRPVSNGYGAVTNHACKRLCQWLCAKPKVLGSRTNRFTASYRHHKLGLVCLTKQTSSFPWAKSSPLSPRAGLRSFRTSGSISGV